MDHNSISILSFSKDQYKDDIIKTISIKKNEDAKTKKPILLDIISKKIILDKDKTTITVKNEWDKPSQKFHQVTFRTRFYTYKK